MLSSDGLAQLSRALKDPVKKKIIARDETLVGGLVLVLSNEDKRIVIETLEILLSLAVPVENRLFLREFMGMTEQLGILAKDTNPLDHIRELSAHLLARVHSEEPVQPVQCQPVQQQLRSRNTNIEANHSQKAGKAFNKPFLNATKFKTITLQIDGLRDKNDMEICRERLLTVKGVVSITFELAKCRSIIRVKPDILPHMLGSAIQQSNTMVARQVLRTEGGEEHAVDLHEVTSINKENNSLPDYLSDEESPVKVDDKAVRRYGAKDEDTGAGWFGAAASFLAKSFYW